MFEILETHKVLEGSSHITVLPADSGALGALLAATAPPTRKA
jgi:hypothetical protein